jgi:hypothetical protein
MDIANLTADTGYKPAFDFDSAAEHLLAWRAAD